MSQAEITSNDFLFKIGKKKAARESGLEAERWKLERKESHRRMFVTDFFRAFCRMNRKHK